ncbi:MAG: CCC motif membrane protein [Ferruginibacter sp.]
MTGENRDYLSGNNMNSNATPLPNATATLVLGILSIFVCFICGIVALVISNKDLAMYKANPEWYSESSYSNLKAGRICAIIGLSLVALFLIIYIFIIAFAFSQIDNIR